MELKHDRGGGADRICGRSNCTFMELKLLIISDAAINIYQF